MIKRFGCGLLLICLSFGQVSASDYEQAANKALKDLGEPVRFCPKIISTEALLACKLPDRIAMQQVVPRLFSEQTLSAILKMGELDRNETIKGASRGVFGTPGVKYYGSLERTHTLTIIPAQGWMRYECLGAITNQTGVAPGEAETVRRGLEIAALLGINREKDLMKHPTANRLDYVFEKTERDSYKKPTRTISQGVFFRRAIDGFRVVTGHYYGGLRVRFGIDGKLHELELTARATKPSSTNHVAALAEQVKMFTECKQVFALREAAFWEEVKKDKEAVLRLENVEAIYFEDAPEKFQKVIPPLLRWEGELQRQGKTETVVFFTPIREK